MPGRILSGRMAERVRVVHPVTGREMLVPVDVLEPSLFHWALMWADLKRYSEHCVESTQGYWNTYPMLPWVLSLLPAALAVRTGISAILTLWDLNAIGNIFYIVFQVVSTIVMAYCAKMLFSWDHRSAAGCKNDQRSPCLQVV